MISLGEQGEPDRNLQIAILLAIILPDENDDFRKKGEKVAIRSKTGYPERGP
jgi:hypothetical protein